MTPTTQNKSQDQHLHLMPALRQPVPHLFPILGHREVGNGIQHFTDDETETSGG